jgi:Peptidase family M1.
MALYMAMNEGLSNNVIPESYKLFFEPDLRTFKSKGEEEITVSLTEKTKKIRINSKEIEILHARAEFDSREITASVNTIPEREEIEFSFEEELKDKVKLKIEFVTQNNDRMYGFIGVNIL